MLSRSAIVLSLMLPAFAADTVPQAPGLTVHEWGTFTSVAAESGSPVSWASLSTPSDLPCFVHRLSSMCVKCNATSMVRMETPVLYFYSPAAVKVNVHVELPGGVFTEWYPKAAGKPAEVVYGGGNKIDWGPVEVLPAATLQFPVDGSESHYYPARNTDSAPLRIADEQEKLIFYRGIADQGVSLEAQLLAGQKLELRATGGVTVPYAVVFENRGGQTGYRIVRDVRKAVTVDAPELTAKVADLHRELEAALVETGLFPKEAAAMVDTWRDSWFEEGMRVFYILPRAVVDAVLPLTVTPAPAITVRAFVGRVELLSPAMRQTVATALGAGDVATLAKCARFLEAFMAQMKTRVAVAPAAQAFIDSTHAENTKYRVAPCKPVAPPTTNEQ